MCQLSLPFYYDLMGNTVPQAGTLAGAEAFPTLELKPDNELADFKMNI
jgi:hypothetical protein